MSKENKTVELTDEELNKVSGGGLHGRELLQQITIEAGYYILEYCNVTSYFYVSQSHTGSPDEICYCPEFRMANGVLLPSQNVNGEFTLKQLSEMTKYNC